MKQAIYCYTEIRGADPGKLRGVAEKTDVETEVGVI
jgi:hypothetical protein